MKQENINKKEIIDKVTPIIEKKAEEVGLIALEVDFKMEAGNWHLIIYIYSPEHDITHEDCKNLTKNLDAILDEVISIPYYLEISSPGLERKLKSSKEYNLFKGKKAEIKLKQPIDDNLKKFVAFIIEYNSGILKVKEIDTNKEYAIEDKNISLIRLKADF